MAKKSKQPGKGSAKDRKKDRKKIEVPKGPCEPEPPKRPPRPSPTRPWDERTGPDPLEWLKLGRKS